MSVDDKTLHSGWFLSSHMKTLDPCSGYLYTVDIEIGNTYIQNTYTTNTVYVLWTVIEESSVSYSIQDLEKVKRLCRMPNNYQRSEEENNIHTLWDILERNLQTVSTCVGSTKGVMLGLSGPQKATNCCYCQAPQNIVRYNLANIYLPLANQQPCFTLFSSQSYLVSCLFHTYFVYIVVILIFC